MNWFISIFGEQDEILLYKEATSIAEESQVYVSGDQDKIYIYFFINREEAIGKHNQLQVSNQDECWTFNVSKNKYHDQYSRYEFMYSKRSEQLTLMLLGQSTKDRKMLTKWNECAGLPIEEKAKEIYKLQNELA